MAGARTGWVPALERLGLLKYILATLFTGLAFVLTAGAYYYEELSRRPPRLPAPPAALLAAPAPPPTYVLRAPVSRAVRFAAVPEAPAGFSFYDIGSGETPRSLADKLGRKRFRVGRDRGESCDFARPLALPAAGSGAVADYIRERSRQCCALATTLPGQLATYAFFRDAAAGGTDAAGPIAGTAVFSGVGAGLLTMSLRFTGNADGYQAAMTRHLSERFGPPAVSGAAGAAWARDGGLVTMARKGATLAVTAYFAANIERHAAAAVKLAGRPAPYEPDAPAARRLALAGQAQERMP
jgi:hypothetical protein